MGWLEYRATKWNRGKIDRKAELIKEFTEQRDTYSYEVLKCSMKGSVGYLAVKYEDKVCPEKNCVFGLVCLTSIRDKYFFAYKDMDESMGPFYYDCPKSILDLLTPTTNEQANEWRKKCRENAQGNTLQKQLQKAKIGSKIRVTYNYDTTLAKKGDVVILKKFGYKPTWKKRIHYSWLTTCGQCYKMSAKMILENECEWIEYIE